MISSQGLRTITQTIAQFSTRTGGLIRKKILITAPQFLPLWNCDASLRHFRYQRTGETVNDARTAVALSTQASTRRLQCGLRANSTKVGTLKPVGDSTASTEKPAEEAKHEPDS